VLKGIKRSFLNVELALNLMQGAGPGKKFPIVEQRFLEKIPEMEKQITFHRKVR